MTNPKPLEITISKNGKHHYHARVKDTKCTCDEIDIPTTIGRLVFENQDMFNVKISIESNKKHKNPFNTNPGSSLP